jgi:hypothetical protein
VKTNLNLMTAVTSNLFSPCQLSYLDTVWHSHCVHVYPVLYTIILGSVFIELNSCLVIPDKY